MIQHREYDWHLVQCAKRISAAELHGISATLQVRVMEDVAHDMGRDVIAYFTARAVEKTEPDYGEPIMRPADWWAALKLRWFPKWWLSRWPAEMEKIQRLRKVRVCPHFGDASRAPRLHVAFLDGIEPPV